MKRTLFLHMGPGLNAYPDRHFLASVHPEFDFWDQPSAHGENAFTDLVEATSRKLVEMSLNSGGKTPIVAHSFGSHLAIQMLVKHPELVESLTLFNAGHDPVSEFHRLLVQLSESSETDSTLREQMRSFLLSHPTPSNDALWGCLGLVGQDPHFMRLYWTDPKLCQAYEEGARGAPALDFQTFHDVLNDFLRKGHSLPNREIWKGTVKLILGEQDPLVSRALTEAYWKSVFPGLQVEIRNPSGHHTYLEDVLRLKIQK